MKRVSGSLRQPPPVGVAFALALIAAGGALADDAEVEVVAPPDLSVSVDVLTLDGQGRYRTVDRAVLPAGETVRLSAPPPGEDDVRMTVIRARAEEKQARVLWRASDPSGPPERVELTVEDFYEPAALDLKLTDTGRAEVVLVDILVTEPDGYVRRLTSSPSDHDVALTIEGVQPGLATVQAMTNTGSRGNTSVQTIPGEEAAASVQLVRQNQAALPVAPLFGSGGDIPEGLHSTVSVAVFAVVLIVWVVVATAFPAVWTYFGIAANRSRVVLSIAAAVIGIVFLGNGVALLLLNEVRYVPLVSAVAASQVVFVVLALLAHVSRKPWARTLSSLGVVFGLLVSLTFLPSFVFEEDDSDIGAWLTIVQLVLVCGASAALTICTLLEGRSREGAEDIGDAAGICPVCGQERDGLTGRCACLPRPLGGETETLARLTVLYANGTRAEVAIGKYTTIGASEQCDLCLGDDPEADPIHAVLDAEHGGLRVSDRDSRTGVYVNGERVAQRRLEHGDEILIGDTWLVVEMR